MSTKALITREDDSPWRRLIWTLPSALSTGIIILWMLAYFTEKPVARLPEPKPVDAQLIEIPSPVIKTPPAVHTPQQVATPKSIKPATPVHAPTAAANLEKAPAPSHDEKPAPQSIATPPPPVPQTPTGNMTGNSGAQAIVRPMPQIPDDLRQEALSAVAIARFHVAIDGTATVELIKPTPNLRLNRLLLETLKNWRFFPSMKDGKPEASIQELSIKVEVK